MKLRYYAVAALMIVAAAGAFAWLLPGMPERVPVHWNVHGGVDRFGSPWEIFFVGPVGMALIALMFSLLPWLSPKRFQVETFERTYLGVMLMIVAMVGYVFAVMLWSALHGPVGVLRAIVGGLCVFHLFIGNVMGRLRRNFFLGIRTPWTLADERVWYATHRLGAKVFVATGVIGFALLLAGFAPIAVLVLLVATALIPIVYSLVYYKRLERQGDRDPERVGLSQRIGQRCDGGPGR